MLDPDVLILDEPTANMDRVSSYGIKEAIGAIRQSSGVTLIIASHDHLWLNQITTRNLELYNGKIRESGHTNIIHGPWIPSKSGLWERHLPDNQRICAVNPPDRDAVALLDPSNIILSTEHPEGISAQNILSGKVTAMNLEREPRKMRVEVMVSSMPVTLSVFSKYFILRIR